jgi:hypothetical protein
VPAAAAAVAATIALTGGRLAIADSDLAPRSAAELLADLQRARLDQLSGTVVQTADLGLPQLPSLGGRGAGGGSGSRSGASGTGSASDLVGSGLGQLLALTSGSHTWRVWYGGEDRQRLALITSLGESDIIHNGRDVWLWSSDERTATHLSIPEGADAMARASATATTLGLPKTPEEAARLALAAIDPTTSVEVGPAVTVAGRTAYELVLKPKDATTMVSQVRIAVDGQRKLPLRAQVFSRKLATPAIEVGFTSIDFSAPEARQFDFTPPGTTVNELSAGELARSAPTATGRVRPSTPADLRATGTGWGRVMVAKLPATAGGQPSTPGGSGASALPQLLGQILPAVSGPWGSGRLLEGTLFSVVVTDDGRVAAGAVAPETLYAALAAK